LENHEYQSDLNLYAYVENNPINRTDPTGLLFVQVCSGRVEVDFAGNCP
jgi:hypothetical protein